MPEIAVTVDQPIALSLQPTKIAINSVVVIPYTSASISVAVYYDEPIPTILSSDEKIKLVNVFMPTPDYLLWLNDDSYLITYVLSKLGMRAI